MSCDRFQIFKYGRHRVLVMIRNVCYDCFMRKRVVSVDNLLRRSLKKFSIVTEDVVSILYNSCRKICGSSWKMPKEPNTTAAAALQARLHESRLQTQRNLIEKNRPASEIYLQVLGNGSRGSARSLFVFTDQWRYMFNCGEGTQRLANEYKAKLSKLDHIFVTHRSWENIGGLPGLTLTIQSIGVPKITLHGPSGIEKLFQMTKGFMLTDDIKIEKRNVDDGIYQDNIMSVEYVPLYGSLLTANDKKPFDVNELELEDYYRDQKKGKTIVQHHNDVNKQVKEANDVYSTSDERDMSVAFICKTTNKPGQLLLEKCVQHGVPPGPLLGQLKNGNDVVLPNGTFVKSSDVVSPDEPGPLFIVLECPTVDFLDSLLENESLRSHQDKTVNVTDVASVVVHFTPVDVLQHKKYQQWLKRFPPSTDHLIINKNCKGLSSFAVNRLQHKLNLLHSSVFPLLKNDIQTVNSQPDSNASAADHYCNTETMLKYQLRPLKKFDRSAIVKLVPDDFVQEAMQVHSFSQVLSNMKSKLKDGNLIKNEINGDKYPEIVFLGTGSSIPSKVRNTSGILLNLSNDKSILMDCGEGTFSQLYRFYGLHEIDTILRRLDVVYISHLHADHHLGLIQLLKERRKAFSTDFQREYVPLILLAPRQIAYWLQRYHAIFEPILDDFSLIGNTELFVNSGKTSDPKYMNLLKRLGVQQINTVYVKHCMNAFGVALHHNSGCKIVYSGDTMPCDALIDIGQSCDVLIHEATMEDELKAEAVVKRHSCTSEAIGVGLKMKAKFIILTHFSQRYAKVPLYNDNFDSRVGIAFDNMKVSVRDLHFLPHFKEALQTLFAEEYEDMQVKTAKKKHRQQLASELKKQRCN